MNATEDWPSPGGDDDGLEAKIRIFACKDKAELPTDKQMVMLMLSMITDDLVAR